MSTPKIVQGAPDVGIRIKLQRLPDPAPTPDPCEVTDVVWVGLYKWVEMWGDMDFITPRVSGEEVGDTKNIVFGANFASAGTLYALPIGPMPCGLEWTWAWSGEVLHNGDVRQEGPLLIVDIEQSDVFNGGHEYENVLTATATCGGAEVGTLSLRVWAMMY